jgi:hypothetical protein
MKKECKWYQVCPMKRFFQQGKLDKKFVDTYCFNDWKSCKRFQLEEQNIPHPDNLRQNGIIDEKLK